MRSLTNLVNLEEIDAYCDEFASRARHPNALRWFRENLRNHIRRSPRYHLRVTSAAMLDRILAPGRVRPIWALDALARRRAVHAFLPTSERLSASTVLQLVELEFAADAECAWLNALPDQHPALHRLDRLSVSDAVAKARPWQANAESTRRGVPPDDPARLQDIPIPVPGWRAVQLTTAATLKHEGATMRHCVGGYERLVRSPEHPVAI